MTVVGVDTRKDTLAACAVDDAGRALGHRGFANAPAGYAELACWISAYDPDLVAVEGSGNYGRPVVKVLVGAGVKVCEVPPNMTAAARRRQRTGTKTDPADAAAIARVGLREPALPPPRPDGAVEELRNPARCRCELVSQRTQLINRLHADSPRLRPGYRHRTGRLTSAKALDSAARMPRATTAPGHASPTTASKPCAGGDKRSPRQQTTSAQQSTPQAPPRETSTAPAT
ncbi:MAG: IS110 family transposase [Acidimicrobiaceae bacterium]|nr:IS110 family transposase [Acidimicrobiaceae bacterium]